MEGNADPHALVHALAATPLRIETAARSLSGAQLTASPAPGEWSPNEILWHIRAQSDVYGEHIARILNEDEPHWRHVSPRARMKKARYDELPFAESLAAFVQQRAALVALLGDVAPDGWQRFAVIRLPDRESRLTLRERVSGMANHEEIHCAQVEAVAGAHRL